jgi:tRNA pseudouridine55 synthase
MATGLLVVGINEATRLLTWWHHFPKTYLAQLEFGKISDTYDNEGIIQNLPTKEIQLKIIERALLNFIGYIKQKPPIFSAKKINGRPAYTLARKKISFKLPAQTVKIEQIKIVKYTWPKLELLITCGSGTYIRSLIHDLGKELNTGAIMTNLNRTALGNYQLKNAIQLSAIENDFYKQNFFVTPNNLLTQINQTVKKQIITF